jgi:succinyl-diaminopimelate desuccinylase
MTIRKRDTDRVVALTQRLVRIPTENPPGMTGEACDVVTEELVWAGFSVQRVEDTPGFVSVVGQYDFRSPGPTLVFNGHLDVVPLGDTGDEWTHDPWGGEVEAGRLYGRGSLDMKGPVAAVIVAAQSAVADRSVVSSGAMTCSRHGAGRSRARSSSHAKPR